MNKKKEAVGKYFADFLRTVGSALLLFSGLGIALDRTEAVNNLLETVASGVLGAVMLFLGFVIVLYSAKED
ncbi:hypothetical protein [Endozoicomonas sp. ALC066]|uniref:hypothetical protein n=1 Tax=Endozoicomonas sp. ALC066 TaxID=3403078 RepID=UPI003BB5598A